MRLLHLSRLLPAAFFAAVFALTWLVQDAPFFWDTVQLASKHAHHFYENGLRWSLLPPEIDSGHPPALGFYLACIWTIFGKTLPASHWAMLPFLLGIVWLALRLGQRFGGSAWGLWLPAILLADPVLAGQMALVSPDVLLLFFFLLAVEAVFAEKRGWLAFAVLCLCLVSMRGMMTAAALWFWVLSFGFNTKHSTLSTKHSKLFLPGFAAAAAFLFWHWQAAGWVGHHPGSPWSPAFEKVDFQGFAKNVAVVGWRWLDFGRVGEWAVVAALLAGTWAGWRAFFREKRAAASLLFWLLLLLTPSALIYQNLSAHRYFLPVFAAFHLLVFQWVASADWSVLKKRLLLAGLLATLAAGNFWRYPIGISMGWDATLAHLPYHTLRREMLAFTASENIDIQSVGTAFPNINCLENTDLNGDARSFSPLDWARNEHVLWSNVYNDFSREDFERLEREWLPLKRLQRGGVQMHLYRRQGRGEPR